MYLLSVINCCRLAILFVTFVASEVYAKLMKIVVCVPYTIMQMKGKAL